MGTHAFGKFSRETNGRLVPLSMSLSHCHVRRMKFVPDVAAYTRSLSPTSVYVVAGESDAHALLSAWM